MRTDIVVTEEEINIAERGLKTRCAIVAAIMNQVPTARHIKVSKDKIAYLDIGKGMRFTFETPPTAASFIKRWDAGQPVGPIGFALTEQTLISARPPRQVSTRQRVKRPAQQPTRNPGSRMIRHPDEPPCAT